MSFYDAVIRNSASFHSDSVCRDMAMLEPGTRAAVMALVADATAQGVDLRVLETYRSQIRQSELFEKGATQLRNVGCHGYGIAVDFGVFISGKYQEGNAPYIFLRELSRRHGLISGQDWGHLREGSFVDSGHVQRIPVWRQDALFSGSWYPPEAYDPYADSTANGHIDVVKALTVIPPAPAKVTQPTVAVASAIIAPGSIGPDVQRLQSMLGVKVTGQYVVGSETEWALRLFQVRHGLIADGRAGAQTLAALAKINQT